MIPNRTKHLKLLNVNSSCRNEYSEILKCVRMSLNKESQRKKIFKYVNSNNEYSFI